jgi:uncharacterized protein (TIGR01619 family)
VKKLLFAILLAGVLATIVILKMGLFDRFRNKPIPHETHNPSVSHEENWAAYVANVEGGHVGSIVIDLGLDSIAPVKEQPFRIAIDIVFLSPRENGFPGNSEFDRLASIEGTLQNALAAETAATYVGHLYAAGEGSIYFYSSDDRKITEVVEKAMLAFPDYSYEVRTNLDFDWDGYRSLYPYPIEMQRIQNDKLIQRLSDQGDNHEKERQVDHWIYFPTDADRQHFIKQILEKRFKVEGQTEVEATDGKPFQLHISRRDAVTAEATDGYILELWKLAAKFNGTYDGWETFIVRD